MEFPAANWPELAAAWRARQLSYTWLRTTMQRYTDFWAVTGGAIDVTLAEKGLDGNAALRAPLLSVYTTLSAYDEVPAVLTRMAKDDQGMVVLSDGSTRMLETGLGAYGIVSRFDRVLSVDALERYKSDPLVYQMGTDVYGCAPADIIFF
jgi:2-haloacid dehalogenase